LILANRIEVYLILAKIIDMISLEEFYLDTTGLVPSDIHKEIGHFNIFKIDEFNAILKETKAMPYNRREYYKISFINGRNRAEYADKIIDINKNALLFATPKIPYNWIPKEENQLGYFCIFTHEFLVQSKSGAALDELPIFQPGGYPIFQLTDLEAQEIERVFVKMYQELSSSYQYKYDLLRNYLLELIHFGQKLQPAKTSNSSHNASTRVLSLFIELLERQFPIASPHQKLHLRTASDYADRLSIHVNHLNKILKENTGKTTTNVINGEWCKKLKLC
jgi:AraC family transcriptional activator of pobA